MRKIDKKFCAWMMAGVITVGAMAGGGIAPAQVWASAEKQEEGQKAEKATDEKTEKAAVEGTVRPSDYVLQPQESYSYADMGLSFQLPQELLEKMESKEVVMLPDAEITEDGSKLKYGQVSWSTMTEEQKEAEVDKVGDGYAKWKESLARVGALGTYHKDLEKDLDELTGCTEHEKIGTSEDGDYIYYLSINKDADKDLIASLKKIKPEITRMVSYDEEEMGEGDSLGSFTTEDINGEEYTEAVFQEADLTMVNVFATWCGPCVDEIPYLAELNEKMKDKGGQVIGIVMDTVKGTKKDDEGIKKAQILAEKTKAGYPFLLPDSGYMNGRLSHVQAFPETFFVDKNGKIVGETYSGSRSLEEWEEIVNTELKGLKTEQEKKDGEKK